MLGKDSMEGSTKTAWMACTKAAVLWNGSLESMRELLSQERRELTPITADMRKGERHSIHKAGQVPQRVVDLDWAKAIRLGKNA